MPDWLPWLWLAPTILFSFVGQGGISFLIIRLIYIRWFATLDSKDLHIQFLTQRTRDLEQTRDRLIVENGTLINAIVGSTIKDN